MNNILLFQRHLCFRRPSCILIFLVMKVSRAYVFGVIGEERPGVCGSVWVGAVFDLAEVWNVGH